METPLPSTTPELRAEIEFYEQLESQCESVRTGPRRDLSAVSSRESLRCSERLRKLKMKVKRMTEKVPEAIAA